MAITYQGAGTATANTSASTTCVVAYPGSIVAGDAIVLFVTSASATVPTNPAGDGFTTGISGQSGGLSPSFLISYKLASGSESGNVTVTTGNAQNQGRMFLFRGVDQTTPIDVAGTAFGSSTGTTAYNIPTLTTTMTGVALFYTGNSNVGTGTFTEPSVPAAFTEVHDSTASSPHTGAGYLIWAGSGATGTINLVRSTSIRGCAGVIALRPAVAAALPPIIVMPPRRP